MGQNRVEMETSGCDLGEARLYRRLGTMLEDLGERPGKSLPTAFQDWSKTKVAYRFFSDRNVSEDKTVEGHFAASALRIQATCGPSLGHRLINAQTDACSRQFDEGKEVGIVFLVSGGDGPVVLEFREEPLDPVMPPVGLPVQRRRIGPAWDRAGDGPGADVCEVIE